MNLRGKLSGHRGETLVETLAAILVVALSSALFLTLISAGVRVSTAGDGAIQKLDEQLSTAEKAETGAPGTVILKLEDGSEKTIPVLFYGDNGQLRSYRLTEGGGTS